MITAIKTERLLLREFVLTDVDFIIELLNTEGWLRFIGDRNVKTREDAAQYLINGPMKSYQLNGFGLLCVELSATKEAIGMCGLIKRAELEDIDIGFSLLPRFEGKGYAYEAAAAIMNHAKDSLKLKRVVAITNDDNVASGKLLGKIGFHFERMIMVGEEELKLFEIEL